MIYVEKDCSFEHDGRTFEAGGGGIAEQALAATDWPPPGDNTAYLVGYDVRRWDEDGECWVKDWERN